MEELTKVLTRTGKRQIMVYIPSASPSAMVRLVRKHMGSRFHRIVYVLRRDPDKTTGPATLKAQEALIRVMTQVNCVEVVRNNKIILDPLYEQRVRKSGAWRNTTVPDRTTSVRRMNPETRVKALFTLLPNEQQEFQAVADANPYEG